MPSARPWIVPAAAAVAFFVAGVVVWRVTSLWPPRRLHPLRAELLWVAGVLLVLVALAGVLWPWPRTGAMRGKS
jgi:protein-S-isoprenylcysteine O-methyltransferase Ste14